MQNFGLEVAEGSDITNLTMPSGTSFPANDNVGELFYRTDLDKLYIRNNTTWEDVTSKGLTYMSNSAHNSVFLLLDGKLYTSAGNSSVNGNFTTGRGLGSSLTFTGCDNFKEVSMSSSSPIAKVGIGGGRGCAWALLDNGELYTWGNNNYGQCGLGHQNSVAFPTLAATGVLDVYDHPSNSSYSTAETRLFIKKTDNYIYGAGRNNFGQLGVGDAITKTNFTQITSLGTTVIGFWNMGSRQGCSVAQKADHTIWIAGYNHQGQFGNGATASTNSTFIDVTAAWGGGSGYILSQVIGIFGNYDGTTENTGRGVIGMLLDNGTTTVFKMAGNGNDSNLGNGGTADSTTPVTPNVGSGRINKIAFVASLGPVQCLKEDGNLYAWGRGVEGNLGDGTTVDKSTPFITETMVADIYCDGWSSTKNGFKTPTFIKKTDGQLYMVGHNGAGGAYGGIGSQATTILTYTRVLLPWDLDVQFVGSSNTSGSGRLCLAGGANGKIYVWGYNAHFGVDSASAAHCDYPSQIYITDYNK